MHTQRQGPIRVVLAKLGLDGHDRGIQVVARALRDAGCEVVYTGLWQTPLNVVRAVEEEDAEVVGVSILSGAHIPLVTALTEGLKERHLDDVQVVVGGIIPEGDIAALLARGVARVFTPGAPLSEITSFVKSVRAPV
jgi:methylmalonyl-CoA mutase C-terminal domain/subunit